MTDDLAREEAFWKFVEALESAALSIWFEQNRSNAGDIRARRPAECPSVRLAAGA